MKFRRLAAASLFGIALASAGLWALADPPREGFAPDPPVHVAEKQWLFEIAYTNGASSIERVRSAAAKKPLATPRVMGRYALELWVGRQLLDRVRFDVPLLGDDERERDPKRPFKRPTFNRVTTKIKAQMADHPRATVLAFVDRATGDTRRYFWPPDEKGQLTPFSAKPALTADAGADAASNVDGGGAGDAAVDAAPQSSDGGSADAAPPRASDASAPDAAR